MSEPTCEERQAAAGPLSRALGFTWMGAGGNFFQFDDTAYILTRGYGDKLVWKTYPTHQRTVVLNADLTRSDLDLVPEALIALAISTLRAEVCPMRLSSHLHYATVLHREGEEPIICGDKLTLGCKGIPPSVYILLPEPEEAGMLMHLSGGADDNAPDAVCYGVVMGTLPKAILYIPDGFDRLPDELPSTLSTAPKRPLV